LIALKGAAAKRRRRPRNQASLRADLTSEAS
jgi:hypothetical protein